MDFPCWVMVVRDTETYGHRQVRGGTLLYATGDSGDMDFSVICTGVSNMVTVLLNKKDLRGV